MEAENTDYIDYQRARFTTRLPARYLYNPAHFWLAPSPDGSWRVGLTKFASRMLGETVDFGFELEPGAVVTPGMKVGWIEGFKALSDLFCVAEGTFAGGNAALETDPSLVNRDPYGAGWLYGVRGQPDAQCVDVHGYVVILDRTIDKLQSGEG